MINKVTLLGRLGKDPEVRHFDNDSAVCNFTVATSESYKGKDGNRVEQTEWHNVAIWRNGLVGVAEKYLKKGSLVYAEGKLRTRSWDDKDGNKRYTTEIIVDNFKMLDGKSGSTDGGQRPAPTAADAPVSTPASDDIADDLPF
ncbi:MAG: single-stranded DNA-binding protein [Chitinophagales bacterium]